MRTGKTIRATTLAATLFVAAACGGSAGVATPEARSGPTSSPASVAPSTPPAASTPSVSPASVPPPTPSPSVAPTATATPGATVDLLSVDPCALLDLQTVRELTGTSLGFLSQGNNSFGDSRCFWGATTALKPAYVEIMVFRSHGVSDWYTSTNHPGCSIFPVAGVATEAFGMTCSDPHKVYLIAWDPGVAVELVVNEPDRPLEPDDLAATIATVLEEIE